MLNVLDLFAGIGGFSLGLELAGGFRTAAFCEQDAACQRVLRKHWPDVPIFGDVRTLTKNDITEPVHVITGGFPCQDISVAGRGDGLDGARSRLWWEYLRAIREHRPEFVLAENSPALRSRGLDTILRSLAEIGYDAEWHCIPACFVGAWHKRDRIWILAYPSRERCEGCPPQPIFRQSYLSAQPLRSFARWPGRPNLPSPRLLGRNDGLPSRLCEVRQYGNAVVPAIPHAFGLAIQDHLKSK